MPSSTFEVCQLQFRDFFEGGVLGFFSTEYLQWEASVTGLSGRPQVIERSEKRKRVARGADMIWPLREELNGQLVSKLAADGWAPNGTDSHGLVTIMRRSSQPVPANKGSAGDLLNSLRALRDAGVLTQAEYESKAQELLRRD